MTALAADDLADLQRWLIAGALVVAAHAGIAATMVRWHELDEASDPVGAVVIEFAPIQTAAPERPEQEAVPEKPIEKVEKTEETIEARGEEQIEQKVEPKPPEEQPRPAITMTTPPSLELPQDVKPKAPVQGTPAIDPRALRSWLGDLVGVLERKKRYPTAAHARREQGTVQVAFTIDRQGHVIDSHIVSSSGAPELDEEALALLKRAQPFPPLPAKAGGGDRVNLTVPIRFSLR